MNWQLPFAIAVITLTTFCMAWAQGWCMAALKLTPDNTPQSDRQQFALHWLLGAVWFSPVLMAAAWLVSWQIVVIAGLLRFILFDPVLSYFEGVPIFSVGKSANTDKLIRWLTNKWNWYLGILSRKFKLKNAYKFIIIPDYLSAVLKAAAFGLLVAFMWINKG